MDILEQVGDSRVVGAGLAEFEDGELELADGDHEVGLEFGQKSGHLPQALLHPHDEPFDDAELARVTSGIGHSARLTCTWRPCS